jgi:hypothetical protein
MSGLIESIKLLSGLLVPLLAVLGTYFGVFIAWHQYVVSRNKLRLDWYDKRFEVYQGLKDLLLYLEAEATLPLEEIWKFRIRTAQSTFLFDELSEIDEFLERIDKKARGFRELNQRLKEEGLPYDVRDKLASEETKLLDWFAEQSGVSKNLFGKYLRPIEPNWDVLGRVRKLFAFVKSRGGTPKVGG